MVGSAPVDSPTSIMSIERLGKILVWRSDCGKRLAFANQLHGLFEDRFQDLRA